MRSFVRVIHRLPRQHEYLVVHIDDDYSQTIVGRSARDYAWIMARISTDIAGRLRGGYDFALRLVPQGAAQAVTPAQQP